MSCEVIESKQENINNDGEDREEESKTSKQYTTLRNSYNCFHFLRNIINERYTQPVVCNLGHSFEHIYNGLINDDHNEDDPSEYHGEHPSEYHGEDDSSDVRTMKSLQIDTTESLHAGFLFETQYDNYSHF